MDKPLLRQLLSENADEADLEKLRDHLSMLVDQAGFVLGIVSHPTGTGPNWMRLSLTWQGHDFLDSVRSPKIWEQTKSGAEAAGGFTVDLLKDLARGFVKKQIEDRTGVKL